jgi:hypothetical protein
MALTKAHNRMIEGAPVNVKDFGAVGDGVTDDRAAIQAAIDAHDHVYFPESSGMYMISNATACLQLRSGVTLTGTGTLTRDTDSHPIIEAIGTLTTHIEAITISGLNFYAASSILVGTTTGDTTNGALRMAYVKNVLIENNTLTNITLGGIVCDSAYSNVGFMTQVPVDFSFVTEANMSQDVKISGNVGIDDSTWDRGTDITGHCHFFVITFTRDYVISNNVMKNYESGLYSLGAKHNNGVDLEDDTIFKNHSGIASDNVLNTYDVGIWAWGCRDLLWSGNIVQGCRAESFDTEACSRITITKNKIIAALGQCLNMFYDNREIMFSYNDCTIDISAGVGDVFINSAHESVAADSNFGRVSLIGNRFEVVGTVGTRSVATIQAAGMKELIVENNYFKNCVVLGYGSQEYMSYQRNEFVNDVVAIISSSSITALIVLSNTISSASLRSINVCDIKDNKFFSFDANIDTLQSIRISNSTNNETLNIIGNYMTGHTHFFNMPAHSVTSQISGSFKLTILCKDNVFDQTNDQPALIQSGGSLTDAKLTHFWINNRKTDGTDAYLGAALGLPNTNNNDIYMSKGSKVWTTVPVASGVEGQICITSGWGTNMILKTHGVTGA